MCLGASPDPRAYTYKLISLSVSGQLNSETKSRGGRVSGSFSLDQSVSLPGSRAGTNICRNQSPPIIPLLWPVLTHSYDGASHVVLICSFFSETPTCLQVFACAVRCPYFIARRATVFPGAFAGLDLDSIPPMFFFVIIDFFSLYCDHLVFGVERATALQGT